MASLPHCQLQLAVLGTTHAFTTCQDGTIAFAFQILKIFDLEEFSNSLQVPEQ
jgi:hypothetical protein